MNRRLARLRARARSARARRRRVTYAEGSSAERMAREVRVAHYEKANGTTTLTSKQARRVRHKNPPTKETL